VDYNFKWDPGKAVSNLSKHGISFRQATQVFKDPLAMSLFDEEHSFDEDRWVTVGLTSSAQYLVVVHTFDQKDDTTVEIRIISARKAARREIQRYQGEST
jgi:uncharacterized protein